MNRTVERTFAILKLIANSESGITLQEISDTMDMAKSSAFVIVHSLLELNYVKKDDNNEKKYRLGIEAFKLGSKYIQDVGMVKQCAQYLPPLVDKYVKTGFLAVLNGCDVVYLYKYVAQNAQLATCAIGSTRPAHATALGKAILAFLPEDKMLSIVDQIRFVPYTPHTITSKEALLHELKLIRQRGYSTERGELSNMTFCCSAPVFDYTGSVIAAISLADFAMEGDNEEALAADLIKTANELSKTLGYISD
ncbi:MAG: hypothetical protein DBY22_01480 [Clostridiales bacterium]|nr:MAG: hypothetical protein DBY22_01480 [Clostridiales bacterium]